MSFTGDVFISDSHSVESVTSFLHMLHAVRRPPSKQKEADLLEINAILAIAGQQKVANAAKIQVC